MNQSWKKHDLEGAGLQQVNIVLASRLKKRAAAYGLWLLFPLGAHRLYLEERIGASAYGALSALALILWLTLPTRYALAPLLAALAFAAYDLLWIDRRLVALNKTIRMNLYLRAGAAPPPGYRGRYTDDQTQNL
ncbi:MAG: TM2 domain-containing protein, partial [Gammaproteobacteria bacterium]|nr:TM2 domain-containing protein [Gammaproteobacteria bacterium]